MKPIVLAILDGFGLREEIHGNAIKQASKPNFDYLWEKFPHSTLDASGNAVGLPEGQMGNSEVGHLNMGAGRLVYQPLELINQSIKNGDFFNNEKLLGIINHVKKNNSKLHILGLLSDGGVHSHINHIMALLELVKKSNVERVYVHVFTDGRDTSPDSSSGYIKTLTDKMKELNCGTIGTISGRYYAMDRDKRWDRVKRAYDVLINNVGPRNTDYKSIIDQSYQNGVTDEFIIPTIVDENSMIEDNDGVIYANFRSDRIIEMGSALTDDNFNQFEVKKLPNLKFVTMMPVVNVNEREVAYNMQTLDNILGEYLEQLSLRQLRIAETEKYAHVTFFFDGEKELDLVGCKKVLIPSPKVATYDLKPEMNCKELTDKLLEELDNDYDVVILNYANCDMVGHTGNMEATIKAVEAVDYNLGRLYDKIQQKDGLLIVTADHGNAEYMLDDNNNVITPHTTNKVPFIVCNNNYRVKDGKLGDIAPTILYLMGEKIPKEMTGINLIN